MLTFRLLYTAGLITLLAGCASMPDEIKLDSPVYSAQNAGLVVGALIQGGPYGTYLEFRSVTTGQTFGWGAKDYYSAWLPAGEYEVSKLGARRGVMGPYTKPLHFTVKQGAINYVGEMAYGCPLLDRPTAVYGVMNCGLLALGRCSVPYPDEGMCVADRQEQAVRAFVRQHPAYANLPVNAALMRGW